MSEKINHSKGVIGVIGAGTMGTGIVQVAARAGFRTILFDSEPRLFERTLGNIKDIFKKLIEKGKMTEDESLGIIARIQFAENLSEFHECDLVIEAIVEDLAIKQGVFRELESATKSTCILASNTSSLSITSIAGACKNPGRILGLHFFNPVPLMQLVEVIPGMATEEAKLKKAKEIVAQLQKTAVVTMDTPGFIVNRIARPYYGEALRIYEEGCYGVKHGTQGFATIDSAMKEFGGYRMGPFELMDLIGNDINYKVTETVWSQFYHEPRYKPALTQKRMVEAGRLGRKSGKGYFDYSGNATAVEADTNPETGKKIAARIQAMLMNEAVDALYLGIASAQDIDLAMTKGVNYPKGLLQLCDETGADKVYESMLALYDEYKEERYRPGILLKKLAAEKKKIFS
jgi:3-hydroxybutyryl-CoA dehydrogenase